MSNGFGCKGYIDFLILPIPTPPVTIARFCSSIPTFCSFFEMFFVLVLYAPPLPMQVSTNLLRSWIRGIPNICVVGKSRPSRLAHVRCDPSQV